MHHLAGTVCRRIRAAGSDRCTGQIVGGIDHWAGGHLSQTRGHDDRFFLVKHNFVKVGSVLIIGLGGTYLGPEAMMIVSFWSSTTLFQEVPKWEVY